MMLANHLMEYHCLYDTWNIKICMFIDCVTYSTQTLILRFIVLNKIGEVIGEHIQRL